MQQASPGEQAGNAAGLAWRAAILAKPGQVIQARPAAFQVKRITRDASRELAGYCGLLIAAVHRWAGVDGCC